MNYLMVWQGVVTNSLHGRDDGQPQMKERVIRSTEELVRTFRRDAEYYRLTPVDVSAAVAALKDLDSQAC